MTDLIVQCSKYRKHHLQYTAKLGVSIGLRAFSEYTVPASRYYQHKRNCKERDENSSKNGINNLPTGFLTFELERIQWNPGGIGKKILNIIWKLLLITVMRQRKQNCTYSAIWCGEELKTAT
ncbi:hypothetical protein NPIL_380841 [Nephila pilipes]|uniref:Uncharacterized protein n=1 Tax=Nephila pilipes TaxID=299642 RepID=A0A8X6MSK8_NEPPI|nr:hypothetical protein NPIL_380841 [Nephila pilipes]